MAVPPVDQLDEYLKEFTDSIPGHVCTRRFLVNKARVFFKTTTPAIEKRMMELIEDGRLKRVRVNYNTCVYLPGQETADAWFVPYQPHPYSPLEHGEVVFERPESRSNLWANGERDLFMTRSRYDALMGRAKAKKVCQTQAYREEKKAERQVFSRAVRELHPSGMSMLRLLNDLVPKSMFTMMSDVGGTEHPSVSLHLNGEELKTFLKILESGLPSDSGDES